LSVRSVQQILAAPQAVGCHRAAADGLVVGRILKSATAPWGCRGNALFPLRLPTSSNSTATTCGAIRLRSARPRSHLFLFWPRPAPAFDSMSISRATALFAHACKMGLEGIVSKRKDSAYRSGRSPDWLKMKNADAPALKREEEEERGKKKRR